MRATRVSRLSRVPYAAAGVALALLLPGCAALTPDLKGVPSSSSQAATSGAAPGSAAASAAHGTPSASAPPTNASATARPAASAPAADSLPSPDAQRVLATIPEPLAPAERVPPPDSMRAHDAAAAPPDTTHGGIPVPAPTEPLGQSSAAVDRMTSPDSALAVPGGNAAVGAAAAGAAAAGMSGGASAADAPKSAAPAMAPGTPCFKLQVGAPTDAKKADGLKRAASSQLELEFDVAHVKTLYKVRTHDCFSREAVDALKARAIGAGFQGVFAVATTSP
jgi:hypothetical protein